jgi:hypothetical protein
MAAAGALARASARVFRENSGQGTVGIRAATGIDGSLEEICVAGRVIRCATQMSAGEMNAYEDRPLLVTRLSRLEAPRAVDGRHKVVKRNAITATTANFFKPAKLSADARAAQFNAPPVAISWTRKPPPEKRRRGHFGRSGYRSRQWNGPQPCSRIVSAASRSLRDIGIIGRDDRSNCHDRFVRAEPFWNQLPLIELYRHDPTC